MADSRFFRKSGAYNLGTIAAKSGCDLRDIEDSSYDIDDIAALADAGPHHLSFLDNKKYREQFVATKAGAVIVHPDMASFAPTGVRLLLSRTPYKSYALAAQLFYTQSKPPASVAKTAIIHPTAVIADGVTIEHYVVIGAGVEIGPDTWIESHAVIQDSCKIGACCRIGAHAAVSYALIGNHVRLYAGVRIGQDGFGFAIDQAGFVKVPQLGRVIIGNHIEIGANTTIDRGASGDTVIGDGTWMDNLVQIGHNVKIGKGCILAAQVGIAGSTDIGDFVAIGGQAGIAGHLKIGPMARIAAKSGVTKNIPAKEEWMGYPALPMKRFLRQVVLLNHMMIDKQKKEA